MKSKRGFLLLYGLMVLLLVQSLISISYVRIHTLASYYDHHNYECIFLLHESKAILKKEKNAKSKDENDLEQEESKEQEQEEEKSYQKEYKHHIYEWMRKENVIEVRKDGQIYFEVIFDQESKSILSFQYL